MNDRPSGGERVLLVHVHFPIGKMEEDLDEFRELAASAGAATIEVVTCTRRVPESKYFVGSGKAEEIRDKVAANKIELVIFNHNLSPAQERNLEQLLKCRVLDRTGLILDIFAQRARSFEGKLQVELAQLRHLSTRLVRGWTHLERQRGGIGLRGPGETQLETDRRLIRNKIKVITARLAKLRKQRELGRRARRKAIVPTVALVGYTNAGKSTLFNRLTGATVYVADQLFATLDPTLRRVDFPEIGPVILADTVGFIRHLPHDLVEAFQATLEEVSEADLLLHVVDASDEQKNTHIEQVEQVLDSIHAEEVPRVLVYNKIDLCPGLSPGIERDEWGQIRRILISAYMGTGMTELSLAISERLAKEIVERELILSPHQAGLRATLYRRSAVMEERIDEEGNYHLRIRLPRVELEKLFH
ncbi:ribosome rescue GTPase HflX [Aquicella lusitana]|uniref:GTPase HflX n=1 Tax=Aquicella lusitana TaxID=254246 RepID=A0A370GD17_9COXI|nr:ribosome rescue GTPase HflX [Aquicella lusitana]RDI41715.1 GTP-binding protein HflX [Aquicella lusitana]VVC72691.1 GTPase HflX [Aquicella lusitana]